MIPGTQRNHYQIPAAIDEGEVGEAWMAKAARFRPEVAINTLPAEFAQDADSLARIEREARLPESLNQQSIPNVPNVAAISGLHRDLMSKNISIEI